MEVEGIVKGRLSFTVMDREGLRIARLGSPDLNFAQLWIKVLPGCRAALRPRSSVKPRALYTRTGRLRSTLIHPEIDNRFVDPPLLPDPCPALWQCQSPADGVRYSMQELVKVGCDVRYLNDSYRLNGLKATAAQQVGRRARCHAWGLPCTPFLL